MRWRRRDDDAVGLDLLQSHSVIPAEAGIHLFSREVAKDARRWSPDPRPSSGQASPGRGRGAGSRSALADPAGAPPPARADSPGNALEGGFTAPLSVWRTEQYGDIFYVTIEGAAAEAIAAHELMRRLELGRRRGFGSVKVEAAVGDSRWSTSVFPQKGGGWFLPVKKAICRAEDIAAEDEVEVRLELL